MKILFVNCQFRLFNDIDCGASNRSTAFVQALANIGHVDVVSFYKEEIVSNIPNCNIIYSHDIIETVSTSKDSLLKKLKKLILFSSPYSYYDLNKNRKKVIDNILNKTNYDILACRYLDDAITCGLIDYKEKLVIEVDDNPVSAFKRQLAVTEFPKPWSRYTTLYRANMVGIMARNLLNRILCSFYSNPNDSPCSKSVYLPNVTICAPTFSPISEKTPFRLLIVGWLDYWPNRKGTLYFIRNVFSKIREQNKNIELHIAGKTEDIKLLEEINSYEGVKALGYVNDIANEYANCRIVVVPVYHGAGTSVKFVEAISMGKCVIATPMGVRGFNNICIEGDDYIIASSDEEFVSKTICLIGKTEEINKIASKGYNIAHHTLSLKNFHEIVKQTILSHAKDFSSHSHL